ncbi:hypothetical protein ACFQ07_15625 [Actinomadura adrarensis]|uniref:Uncharacterized protein n=1 Tax=Actinomadura adrarensis TaxID=1819600 RepID=A0ABW3CJB9_9ACTN
MASKPLEQVTLADLATKDDLKNLATKDDLRREIRAVKHELRQEIGSVKQELRQEIGSAVNLIMGELGKIAARQEEQGAVLARLVARSEGLEQ